MIIDKINRKYWYIPVTIACILSGLLFQFKPVTSGCNNLAGIINKLETERDNLQKEVFSMKEKINIYEDDKLKEKKLLNTLNKELLETKLKSGFIPVKGEGITITLKDSPSAPHTGEDPYFFIVHDTDLRTIITELWAAGGEAISINGERIIATTSIRCVGPSIMVNTTRLLPPYEINVIGSSEKLQEALKMPGGYMDSMALSIKNGVIIDITLSKEVKIPAYKGDMVFQYAMPDRN